MSATYVIVVLFISALCFASFLHTLGTRLVDVRLSSIYQKLILPSRCDYCETKIPILYLVPVLGYLLCAGRCRSCQKMISPLYPLIEILYAFSMVFLYIKSDSLYVHTLLLAVVLSLAVVVTAADLKVMLIPDTLSLITALSGVVLAFLRHDPMNALWGGIFLGGVFFALLLVLPGSFGGGDAKYAVAIGIVAGFPGSLIILEIALVIGSLWGIVYGLASGRGLRIRIPFAPFLVIGLYCVVFFEREILMMYQSVLWPSY